MHNCDSHEVSATVSTAERILIDRAVQGDQQAFAKLVGPYERIIFVSAMAILNNENDAVYAAADGILKAFEALEQFQRTTKFSTWLLQIVINKAELRLQKERRGLYESLDEEPADQGEEYVPTNFGEWQQIPSPALDGRELRETLNAAWKSLPGKYRVVMALRDMAHLNNRETADVLSLTEDNVKARLGRARLQIREALAARLGSLSNSELGRRFM
jgi:RNA polymerase sigma-70 factor, ECF subfamily